jgi:glucose-6-phosphate 1-epimerase
MSTSARDLSSHGIEGALRFEDSPVGPRAVVSMSECDAEVYLHGAQVTRFRPRGQHELLFLSAASAFSPGKAIRGGVPIVFPWFGDRSDGAGPAHGFARITRWSLQSTRKIDRGVELVLRLAADDATRALGYDAFSVDAHILCGRSLEIALTVSNLGAKPLSCEAALHSYLAVADIGRVQLEGLVGTRYVDKVDGGRRKEATAPRMAIVGEVDQVHLDTGPRCVIHEDGRARAIVEQEGARATVVWNPGVEKTKQMRDLEGDAWRRFLCVETAAVADNRLLIDAGASHRLTTRISAA